MLELSNCFYTEQIINVYLQTDFISLEKSINSSQYTMNPNTIK